MWKQAIASFLQAFVFFVFFILGFCLFLLPQLPEARWQIAHVLLNEEGRVIFVGGGFFFVAFLLLVGFYGLQRGRFLQVKMGGAEIQMRVIQKTLEECFKTHFSKKVALEKTDLIEGKKLEITVRFPPLTPPDREALFLSIEKHLQGLLKEKFGYTAPFFLNVRVK